MRKLTATVLFIACLGSLVYAGKAEDLMAQIYLNNAKITTANVTVAENVLDATGNTGTGKTMNKQILLKNPDKIKVIYLDQQVAAANNTSAKKTTSNSPMTNRVIIDKKAAHLNPECVFDAENFFKNFVMTVKEKDARIKLGRDEVIATRKGQTLPYPQIRLMLKDGKIQTVKFYSIKGQKYYEVKINSYSRISGIDIPDDIVEKTGIKNNVITNKIKYKQIQLNTTISDGVFVKN